MDDVKSFEEGSSKAGCDPNPSKPVVRRPSAQNTSIFACTLRPQLRIFRLRDNNERRRRRHRASNDSSDFEAFRVDMVFESVTNALHAVQDYALAQGRDVKVKQRSGMHRAVGCTSADCKLGGRVYRKRLSDKPYGSWYISSIVLGISL